MTAKKKAAPKTTTRTHLDVVGTAGSKASVETVHVTDQSPAKPPKYLDRDYLAAMKPKLSFDWPTHIKAHGIEDWSAHFSKLPGGLACCGVCGLTR